MCWCVVGYPNAPNMLDTIYMSLLFEFDVGWISCVVTSDIVQLCWTLLRNRNVQTFCYNVGFWLDFNSIKYYIGIWLELYVMILIYIYLCGPDIYCLHSIFENGSCEVRSSFIIVGLPKCRQHNTIWYRIKSTWTYDVIQQNWSLINVVELSKIWWNWIIYKLLLSLPKCIYTIHIHSVFV